MWLSCFGGGGFDPTYLCLFALLYYTVFSTDGHKQPDTSENSLSSIWGKKTWQEVLSGIPSYESETKWVREEGGGKQIKMGWTKKKNKEVEVTLLLQYEKDYRIACNSTQSPEGVSSVEGLNMLNCTITAGCEWHQSFLQLSDIMHNIFQHLLHTDIKVASTAHQQFLHSNLSK